MSVSLFFALSAGIFTIYPGFIDPQAKVQVATDKGPIVELVIACGRGEGVMSFSKIDRKFCIPNSSCYNSFSVAYVELCN